MQRFSNSASVQLVLSPLIFQLSISCACIHSTSTAIEYRSVMEAKQKLEQNARDHDLFFRQLRGSKDGFSVVADYFSKGIVSNVLPENGR